MGDYASELFGASAPAKDAGNDYASGLLGGPAPETAQPEPKSDISHTGGLSGHATQGALFSFGDEYLAGLSAVLGVQPDGKGGANWFQWDKPIGERYEIARDQIRRELGEYQEENPGKALAAQVVGGGLTASAGATGLGIKAAATPLGRGAQIMGGGALAGGIEGYGSGEGVGNRAINAGIGAAAGAVFAPVVGYGLSRIARFMKNKGGDALSAVFRNRNMFDPKTGAITAAGEKRLAQLGYKAKDLSREMLESFGGAAKRATAGGADDAAVARLGAADRFGVPLTRGQATGDVAQWGSEEAFRAAARGPKAAGTMAAFDTAQDRAVETARDAVGAKVGTTAIDRTDAADAVIAGVRREAKAAHQAGKAAYDTLEAAGAAVTPDSVRNLSSRITNGVRMTGHTIDAATTNARAAVNYIRNTLDNIQGGAVPFLTLERARQELGKLKNAAFTGSNGADQTVMGALVDTYDAWLDDTVTNALMQGDDAVLKQAQQARSLWAKYRSTFLSKKGADNFVRKIVTDDLSPDQVASWLYGAATTPGGGQTSLVARRIRDILGPDSEDWMKVKRAAWDHITRAAEGKKFGPQRVGNNISEFIGGKGKTLARELFTPDELRLMGEFRDLMKVLTPPPRSVNPSGTAYALQRGMLDVLGTLSGGASMGPLGAVAGKEFVSGGSDFAGNLAARAAARGITPRPPSVAIAAGTGAMAGAEGQRRVGVR